MKVITRANIVRQGVIMFIFWFIILIVVIIGILAAHRLGEKMHALNEQMEQNDQKIEQIEHSLRERME